MNRIRTKQEMETAIKDLCQIMQFYLYHAYDVAFLPEQEIEKIGEKYGLSEQNSKQKLGRSDGKLSLIRRILKYIEITSVENLSWIKEDCKDRIWYSKYLEGKYYPNPNDYSDTTEYENADLSLKRKAKRIETRVHNDKTYPLVACTKKEIRRLEGTLAAARWLLGEQWGSDYETN